MEKFIGQINGKDFFDENTFKEELKKAIESGCKLNASIHREYQDENQTEIDFGSKPQEGTADEKDAVTVNLDKLFPSKENLETFLNEFNGRDREANDTHLAQMKDGVRTCAEEIKENWHDVDFDDFLIRRSRILKHLASLMEANCAELEKAENNFKDIDRKIEELNESYLSDLRQLNKANSENLKVRDAVLTKKAALEFLEKFFKNIVSSINASKGPVKTECTCKQEQKETPYNVFDTDKFWEDMAKIFDFGEFGR